MPYKSEKIKLSREQDRRVKLTSQQREAIRGKYATGCCSQRELAKEYGVSKRLIQFVLDEEKALRAAEQLKERRKDGRYSPTKEARSKTMREHRRYKQALYNAGELKEKKSDGDFLDR